jgi:hypothetical protein
MIKCQKLKMQRSYKGNECSTIIPSFQQLQSLLSIKFIFTRSDVVYFGHKFFLVFAVRSLRLGKLVVVVLVPEIRLFDIRIRNPNTTHNN